MPCHRKWMRQLASAAVADGQRIDIEIPDQWPTWWIEVWEVVDGRHDRLVALTGVPSEPELEAEAAMWLARSDPTSTVAYGWQEGHLNKRVLFGVPPQGRWIWQAGP